MLAPRTSSRRLVSV
uniref:Uncharacterized protein n=1 Tax=Arundo donax TaxID=35708 RepID=A0A0A9F3U3_ARUDO